MLCTAAEAVRRAGSLLRDRSRDRSRLSIIRKGKGDWTTNADHDAEQIIMETIARVYPSHGFFAEESGAHGDAELCWAIDPLDGTTNFIHGYPHYAVSAAFCRNGRPEAGVIYDICRDDLYFAERGGGAFVNDRRLRISEPRPISDSLFLSTAQVGSEHWRWSLLTAMRRRSAGIRRSGSTALDFAHAAAGFADGIFGGSAKFWDIAAGMLLVREAGGFVANLDGGSDFPFPHPTGFFAAGGEKMVTEILRAARRLKEESDGAD